MKALVLVYAAGGSENCCYECEGLSLEMILRIEQTMLHPFVDFEKIGKRINFSDSVEREQKKQFSYSVTFDLDTRKVQYWDYNERYILLPML